ncbi:MAG: FrgA protein, partial [Myxococcota bacterium]|nr:FrgA protein [Myxococcota bacterium]
QAPTLSAALQPTPDVVPDWSIADARAALKVAAASGDRDQVIDVALTYARRTFEFAAAFAVLRGSAVGWDARGQNATREMIAQVSIPLDATSVFRTVALSRGSFTGPLPPDTLNLHYLSAFGRQPRAVFLFPVEVKARLVALVYGDSGTRPFSQRRLSDFLIFCQELPAAFQELILLRKRQVASASEEVELTVETPVAPPVVPSAPAGLEPAPSSASSAGLGWGPLASNTGGRTGRAASMPALTVMEAERPPPDFNPILRRLTGPDPTERARAMAELARAPEASSRVLASRFPGPTAWSRLPVMELPEADELGPIPGALARLGRPAATALAPLLDSDDSDTRYLALLTAGNLPYPELVDGVLRGLFDLEPDISSAARAAATALRKLPRFDAAMKDLRQELTARDPLRRGLAARALGVLHDREAIDGLVGLTGSEDQLTAQAAAEALREITRQSHGTNSREWLMWWAENRGRRRIEWLVSALRHRELDIRTSAIEELTRTLNDSLGYAPDGATAEREEATRRWEALMAQGGRWQKIEI